MQDIAGCRVVVQDIVEQDVVLSQMRRVFPDSTVTDRRVRPSHGYRAVHVVVVLEGKAIEIQLRTAVQHVWAELSEKFSDVVDPAVKYGGGDARIQELLLKASQVSARIEQFETEMTSLTGELTASVPTEIRSRITAVRNRIQAQKDSLISELRDVVAALEQLGE